MQPWSQAVTRVTQSLSLIISNTHSHAYTPVYQCWDLAWTFSLEGTARHI